MNHEMIPCTAVLERLWAFIDGELDAMSEEEVRRHLEACSRCYPRYDFQRRYFGLMKRAGSGAEPAELRRRILHSLLQEAVRDD